MTAKDCADSVAVSVVVPVYNVYDYLEECVNSIINQSLENIEILLVDDGSTDGSSALCDDISEKYPNVRVIHQENNGVSVARNVGIAAARGEYIGFVDSDDRISPDMYFNMVKTAKAKNASIVQCRCARFFVDGEIAVNEKYENSILVTDKRKAARFLNDGLLFGSTCNKLYRKDILQGVCFNKELKCFEDELFNWEVIRNIDLKSNPIYMEPFVGYFYRVRENSASHKPFQKSRFDILKMISICKERYKSHADILFLLSVREVSASMDLIDLCIHNSTLEEELPNLRRRIKANWNRSVGAALTKKQRIKVCINSFFPTLYSKLYCYWMNKRIGVEQ